MEQLIVFGTLIGALALFIHGRLRYDVVAMLALLVVTITGVIPQDEAFAGFGHPAVITVAGVLVASRGLVNAGGVVVISRWIARAGNSPMMQVIALTPVVVVSSAFMNNVGALALLMPTTIRIARRSGTSPSLLLMPLAFGSLLGGLITLIGTPPNIIIASFRESATGEPFRMFDFTPVGLGIALAGSVFLALIGWRLVPQRQSKGSREELFDIEAYTTEVHVSDASPLVGKRLNEFKNDIDIVVSALLRNKQPIPFPSPYEIIRADDILIVEAGPVELSELIDTYKLDLVGRASEEQLETSEVSIVEAIVTPQSQIINRTPRSLNLRQRYRVNLLAVSRKGERVKARLSKTRFQAGDVLLLQAYSDALPDVLAALGCLPLAERAIKLAKPRRLAMTVALFAGALILAATGVLPIAVAIVSAAVAMILLGIISLKEAYDSIDWPVIVLLGAMIPVGSALELSGGAQTITDGLLAVGRQAPPVVALAIILIGTMTLSDLINNAAAAVLVAPIALHVAEGLGVSSDPFLMAVAIGASCAFLTPIGHQSNTLVMGPGGYHFGDYWRVGLPLEILIVAVALPLLLIFWPL